jgi:hypothetical protein
LIDSFTDHFVRETISFSTFMQQAASSDRTTSHALADSIFGPLDLLSPIDRKKKAGTVGRREDPRRDDRA